MYTKFLYSATYFYRQALQLVPDIESKIKDFTNFNLESGKSINNNYCDFKMKDINIKGIDVGHVHYSTCS